jgi:hypothetical protein
MMGKNGGNLISVSTREASLKRRLRRHLRALGFHKRDDGTLMPPGKGKDAVRTIHSAQRNGRLAASQNFLSERLPKLLKYFASGEDVDPASISPVLQPISSDTWEGDLFRLASLTWSVPVPTASVGDKQRKLSVAERASNMMGALLAVVCEKEQGAALPAAQRRPPAGRCPRASARESICLQISSD